MAARRCEPCEEMWPDGHVRCPRCRRLTVARPHDKAVRTEAEALSAAIHSKFDAYYAKREKDRELRGDVSPDVLGRLEARRDLAGRHADG